MSLRVLTSKVAARSAMQMAARQMPIASTARFYSSAPAEDPKAKASSLINALPGNSVLSKTGLLATGTAAAIYTISNELYILNDETILLTAFLGFCLTAAKLLAPGYGEFASNRVKQVTDILNASRNKHVDAVKQRIESVSELKDVTETTKVLFEISKETVELEAKAFELKQKVDIAAEAKSVLDSWVRYENNIKQEQQKQIAEQVIAKVQAELKNPKFQEKVLNQSVTEIEQLFAKL